MIKPIKIGIRPFFLFWYAYDERRRSYEHSGRVLFLVNGNTKSIAEALAKAYTAPLVIIDTR